MTDLKFYASSVTARVAFGAALLLTVSLSARAQFELAPSVIPRAQGVPKLSTEMQLKGKPTTADYILAVVNQEPITFVDVERRVQRVMESAGPNSRLPALNVLRQQVLDALIDEKAQVQFARNSGLQVGDAEVEEGVASIAAQNQLSLPELKARMKADGLDFERYRNSLREQMMLERVRSREVNARIVVSDADADQYLAAQGPGEATLHLAHILIPVSDKATPAQIKAASDKAEALRERAAAGVNFAQLVKDNSGDAGTRDSGGDLGMRPVSRLPDLFTRAMKDVPVGKVGPVVRSGAGFHVLKLIEREDVSKASYTQQRARHILIRNTPKMSVEEAVAKLKGIRAQIISGQSSFAQMARQFSEDGSATKGGELGWAVPGQFVPEFEKALLALQTGQISEPVVSRFGVHLVQLIERREVALTEQQKRESAKAVLREQRFEQAYEDWARELRAAAFVEMRNAP